MASSAGLVKVEPLRISHVAALVPDVSLSAKFLGELLGWGPWSVYDLVAPRLQRRRFRNTEGVFGMIGAETHLGSIDFALNQSVAGPSIYSEYIARRGFGLHHIACMADVAGIESVLRRFSDMAIGVTMEGWIDDELHFLYFDTEPTLGVAVESGSGHAISLKPDRIEPLPRATPPPARLSGVTVVVTDIEAAVARFARILGWGPWETDIHMFKPDHRTSSTQLHVARTRVEPIEVSVVEPQDDLSFEGSVLKRFGEGLCQISCLLPAPARSRTEEVLSAYQSPPSLRVREGDREWWYVDGVPPRLKLIFESDSGESALVPAGGAP